MEIMVKKFHVCHFPNARSLANLVIISHQTIVNGWLQNNDQKWIRKIGSFCDPFDPSLISTALADTTHGFRSVVFGWDTMGEDGPCDDVISKLFEEFGKLIP